MPLSWNEIKARAAVFSKEWAGAGYEKGETQSFYNAFFEVFGRRRRDVAVYEEKVKKLDNNNGFIDLFWPGQLLVEQKSAGRNLESARNQATDYFLRLKENEKPRYILLSDFQTFELLDLEENREYRFPLSELVDNVRHFGFIAGYHEQKFEDQDPANITASELMSGLHKQMEESGYTGHHLERFLVRLVFCLFADDTGIFQPDAFLRYIEDQTAEDGSDLGSRLINLFEVLDTPENKRQKTLDENLNAFPYVNGNMFSETIRIPSFNTAMRKALLECCYFDWSKISPALFGSLFQTVMLPEEQRKKGAHYTSEKNILKTIRPLFMDELREEFEKIKSDKGTHKKSKLTAFQDRLSELTFFDPACGCGNFLILAYRELRLMEIEILEELYPAKDRQTVLDISHLSKIDVDQFFGIEIEEFPARIAETAMWLVDHQMNMRLSETFGQAVIRLPLKKSAKIFHGNALTTDWNDVIPAAKCSYILGNPPFIGKAYRSEQQQHEVKNTTIDIKGGSDLDYVCCWFIKASNYIQNTKCRVSFVATNSISQGEQALLLWGHLLTKYHIDINFAHQTFKWTIDEKKAKGMRIASVHVVIIGFANFSISNKYIYEYENIFSEPVRIKVDNISQYLTNNPTIFIRNRKEHIQKVIVPKMAFGNMPNDGGFFIFSNDEKNDIEIQYPKIIQFIKLFLGSREYINGIQRWCLWLKDVSPSEYRHFEFIKNRIQSVKEVRLKSNRDATRKLAEVPSIFGEIRQPQNTFLAIPEVSSENRKYIPIGFLPKDVIPSNKLYTIDGATLYHFGILTSEMHMVWMRYTCGRLESRYQYSNGIVYNNFPWPETDKKQQNEIAAKAQAVLDARKQFPDSTLADLYDPNTMPPELLKAHQALDAAVDKSYRKTAFKNEKERIEFLFDRYQTLTAPLDIKSTTKKTKRRSRKDGNDA